MFVEGLGGGLVAELSSLVVWAPDSSQIALAPSSDEALNAGFVCPDTIIIVDIAQLHNRETATGIGRVYDLTWSPNTSELLVVNAADKRATILTSNQEIYALDVMDGTIDRPTDYDGIDSRPAWARPTE